MEKCVDSDYLQPENEVTETQKNATCSSDSCLSSVTQEEKSKCKNGCKVSRVDEKIASQERSSGPANPIICNGARAKSRRHRPGRRVNVLKKQATATARRSVQKKTKINKSHVPDRLEKYVSSSFRPANKLPLGDRESGTKTSSNEASLGEATTEREGDGETKIALLGNECLSNKEADRLRNSFESDSETINIFEKFFDDCLDSTSRREGVSSQENVNSEKHVRGGRAAEVTPEKRKPGGRTPGAPVKVKDHSGYYSNHKNVRHVCEYCHKIFKSNGKLNSHVYSHTGERPFDCSHCGKAFSSKFKLVRHLLIHSEVRKFVCQICDRTFLRNDHLKNHYKVHDPQKKMYKCPKENCDKEYSSIMSHKKHMAYHSVEDGDLKCLICNVKYETKEEVLFHLKSHSGSRLFKTQSDKKFKCDFCDRLFLTRKDVTRHLVVHTGERDFLCQFCPQRFGRKDHLVRHIKKSHRNEDLPRTDDLKPPPKEDTTNRDDTHTPPPPPPPPTPIPVSTTTSTSKSPTIPNQNPAPDKDNKTHILITLQNKTHHPRKKKPFHKNQLLVPKKNHAPSKNPQSKNPTTQILLKNIPNILIIPNNSIILLRNQTSHKKNPHDSSSTLQPSSSPVTSPSASQPPSTDPNNPPQQPPSQPPNPTDFINFPYDSNPLPFPSEFLNEFTETDTFSDFHPDLPPFGPHFEPDFDLLPADPPPAPAVPPPTSDSVPPAPPPPTLLTDAPRPDDPTPVKSDREKPPGGVADRGQMFDDGAFMLNESILNELKDDSGGMLPAGNEVGILGNLLNQSGDNCGFELLRHLLTTDNPVLSPLPGFSQIFHNSNANSN